MTGVVYKSTGKYYQIKTADGSWWTCKLKGKIKLDGAITSSNPIAVGDIVDFEIESKEGLLGTIFSIHTRRNSIARISPQNRRHQQHVIASNLDQVLIIATLANPSTSQGFIDRILITAEAYHIPATIVINKADTFDTILKNEFDYVRHIYGQAGYEVLLTSTVSTNGLQELISILQGKKTLFTGHSGVGKSSIINLLSPQAEQKVQEVSDWSGKGKHTTTFAEMIDIDHGGAIIDTPGVKEFGIIGIDKYELSHYFPEMRPRLTDCKFNNCLHINEPQCAIKAAVESHEISIERYESYLSLIESLPEPQYD